MEKDLNDPFYSIESARKGGHSSLNTEVPNA